MDRAGTFRRLPSLDDSRLAEIFAREVLRLRKVYEVDPMICPRCGGRMRVVAFLTEHGVVDRFIGHLKLTFVAEKPPPDPRPASCRAGTISGD
jgi:hypothetical protein